MEPQNEEINSRKINNLQFRKSLKKIRLNVFLKICRLFFPINCGDLPCIYFFILCLKQILLPVGLLAQYYWLECCTSIERSSLNPNMQAWIFSGFSFATTKVVSSTVMIFCAFILTLIMTKMSKTQWSFKKWRAAYTPVHDLHVYMGIKVLYFNDGHNNINKKLSLHNRQLLRAC